ncbi:MAG: cell division protein ZipA [Gammaproteobacteria bacterium]
MTELRWILLILGLIALVAIYVFGRKEQRRRRRRWEHELDTTETTDVSFDARVEWEEVLPEPEPFDESPDPHLDEDESPRSARPPPSSAPPEIEPAPEPGFEAPPEPELVPPTEEAEPQRTAHHPSHRPFAIGDKIISLYVVARRPAVFRGDAIAQAAEMLNLEYGEMQIYNRMVERGGRRLVVFSMANAVQPGTFDVDNLRSLTTPGLALFMQLPGPLEGLKAFNAMLDCAQQLSAELDGELLDETRSVLSTQTVDHLREEIQLHSLRHARVRHKDRAP